MLGMEDFRRVHLQVLGGEDTYGPHATLGDVSTCIFNLLPVFLDHLNNR